MNGDGTIYSKETAEAVAAKNRQDDPEWDYRAVHIGGLVWKVSVYDETGAWIGYL